MAASKDHLQLYLDQYAESIAKHIAEDLLSQDGLKLGSFNHCLPFKHCLVVPAYNESTAFLQRLKAQKIDTLGRLLLIVIINQPKTDNNIDTNQQLWEWIRSSGENALSRGLYQWVDWQDKTISLLAVDRFHQGLPAKQGVGLARKIGCDLASALIAKNGIHSHWIHTSDADVHLPQDYFIQVPGGKNISALVYPYQHIGDHSNITEATQLYEQGLYYYTDGLEYAGSPYCFQTLGSCIAVNVNHYAQARGFPKRAGGEDFYLLNKLAKLGVIKKLNGDKLKIDARISNRVPFGTGPAVEKIEKLQQTQQSYTHYNHQVFKELKQLLINFPNLYEHIDKPQQWLHQNSVPCQYALKAIGIDKLFHHLGHQRLAQEYYKTQIHHWFDGFRTLRFIHELEAYHPKQQLGDAIKGLEELKADPS